MTNKQMQTIMAICITFTVVFSVIALITMDLLFQRCDTLEEVLYNTKKTAMETQVDLINLEQAHTNLLWECTEMQKKIDMLNNEIAKMQTQMIEKEIATVEETVLNYDYDYVLRVVAAECRGEPLNGQMGVAQCIRETSEATGMTPEEVVKQVNPNGTRQYSTPVSMDLVNDNVREACERVFINGESAVDEPIRYFYSIRNGGYSAWHENSLEYVITIGNHKFFKAK